MKVLAIGLCISLPGMFTAHADIFLTASSFGVLAGSGIANSGVTVVGGNVGVSPVTSVTGFPPGLVTTGNFIDAGNASATQAEADLSAAYSSLSGLASTSNLTGVNLGGLTLTPGVYRFDAAAQLTGTLTLNAMGAPNAYWVFEIGSTLNTASASAVQFINNGPNEGLFWQVGSSATLGTNTAFEGNIVALTSITLDSGADISCGRALAVNGAVTLDTNSIDNGCAATADSQDSLSGFVANGNGGLSADLMADPAPEPRFVAVPLGLGLLALRLTRSFGKRRAQPTAS